MSEPTLKQLRRLELKFQEVRELLSVTGWGSHHFADVMRLDEITVEAMVTLFKIHRETRQAEISRPCDKSNQDPTDKKPTSNRIAKHTTEA